MEERETPQMCKYGERETTRIMMETVPQSLPKRDVRNITPMDFCSTVPSSFYPSINISGTHLCCGPDTSVCIATDYRMDGPGSDPSGGEFFHPFRPALGPTQPPLQYVIYLAQG